MITPIRNLALGNIKLNKQTNSKNNSYKQTNYSTNPNATLPSFTGYLGQKRKVTFDWGVENNLFKLPIVTLEDGTEKQLTPDKSQQECAKLLCDGKNVLFDAPTGMGKTSVAHFAMGKNLIEGKKTVYTVPIKALANDKYAEFTKIYGEENVGILTGDRKINTNAPITIMTTEIFDNQAQGLSLNEASKIGTVIYDEAHYIGDEERGFAWEHSILNSASKGVQTLLLSATIGNAEELAKWIGKIPGARPTQRVEVPPENRPVPLVWHIYRRDEKPEYLSPIMIGEINLNQEEELTERQKQALEVVFKMEYGYEPSYEMSEDDYDFTYSQLKLGIGEGQNNFRYDTETFKRKLKKEFRSLDSTQLDLVTQLMARTDVKNIKAIHENWRPDDYQSLVKTLEKEDMLPAIIFKLAQRGCEEVADSLSGKNPRTEELLGQQAYKDLEETSKKLDLLTKEEKEKVQEILDKYEQNGVYLGLDSQKNMLLRGYAVHHAGRMPQYKKLVEELFSKKLIKVVVSTSTLGAGINMPARTVVM
ncbi:MAG: DEAD/DEAH box helicase, partial [Candidatus Gastranaerophilales bacterium]|nr:DEAD/DEAH box helicase [Candidatus Gastranaerophilales bacterium]